MKFFLSLFIISTLFNLPAYSQSAGGSASIEGNRLKIQLRTHKDLSGGPFELRDVLIKHGFKVDDGMLRTHNDLAPLEIYNYLYKNGTYVFTIFLPISNSSNQEKLFISFDKEAFISFEGEAAKLLFDVLKAHLPKSDINNLEKYRFGTKSYCDRTTTIDPKYRCWITK